MDLTKLFGWVLLIGGVGIIFWTLHSSYQIFTNQRSLPEFFVPEKKEVSPPPKKKFSNSPEEIQQQALQMILERIQELFPQKVTYRFFNLFAWSVLAGIFIFGGSQISSLGIRLIKK